MKRFAITCVSTILCTLAVTCLLNLNKTEEVIETIETQEEKAPVYNNYETHNHYEQPVKEVVREVVVEKEVIVEKEPEEEIRANESERKSQYNDYVTQYMQQGGTTATNPNNIIICEVCEQSGTELEVWYDSNNIKHITCKTKCTGGLDALYGE